MSQQVHASIRFNLPDGHMEEAAALAAVGAAWQQFSVAVREAGVTVHEQTFTMAMRASKRPYTKRPNGAHKPVTLGNTPFEE